MLFTHNICVFVFTWTQQIKLSLKSLFPFLDWIPKYSSVYECCSFENRIFSLMLILPWIASQGGVVQRVEPVVVGESHVSAVIQQQCQYVITLLRYRVMQRSIALGIL